MTTTPTYNQETLIAALQEAFETAPIYEKYQQVNARPALIGEKVVSITSDGRETVNYAEAGDWVVQNNTTAQEQYIVSSYKFEQRYATTGITNQTWEVFKAKGKCKAIVATTQLLQQLKVASEFYFTAPWGEPMVCKQGDLLVCPNINQLTEVYRIAKQEFEETYRLKA